MRRTLVCMVWVGALLVLPAVSFADDGPSDAQVRGWVEQLSRWQRDDPAQARAGIAALEPTTRAIDIVRALLSDANPYARAYGARTACEMGAAARPLIPDLIENLRDEQVQVRMATADVVGHVAAETGDDDVRRQALERLIATLDDPSAKVRAMALRGLVSMRALGAEAVTDRVLDRTWASETLPALFAGGDASRAAVAALVTSPSWHVRRRVVRALHFHAKTVGVTAPFLPLIEARSADDPSSAVRVAAIRALGAFGRLGADVTDGFAAAVRDPHPMVRSASFREVEALEIARAEQIAAALLDRIERGASTERAAAAWLLRRGPVPHARIDAVLRRLRDDPDRWVVVAGTVALLDRGHRDTALLTALIDLVEGIGVTEPYPEPTDPRWPERSRGGKKRSGEFPQFRVTPHWCAGTLARLGGEMVPRIVARLGSAAPDARTTWIHALAHTGAPGRAALAAGDLDLTGDERFEGDLIRAHAGEGAAALAGRLLAVFEAGASAVEVAYDEDGQLSRAWRQALLAKDALVRMGATSVPALVAAMADVTESEDGIVPDWCDDVARTLRAIGPPALEAVARAAADEATGYLFRPLLEGLQQDAKLR